MDTNAEAGRRMRTSVGWHAAGPFVLWSSLLAGIALALWFIEVAGLNDHQGRKDPRILVLCGLLLTYWSPAVSFRQALRIPALRGWHRVVFTAIGTAVSIGVVRFWLWLATTNLPFSATTRETLGRLADLSDMQAKWNSYLTLVLGVIFWLAGLAVASDQPMRVPRKSGA